MNLGLGPAGTSFGVAKSTRIISDLLSATNLEKKKKKIISIIYSKSIWASITHRKVCSTCCRFRQRTAPWSSYCCRYVVGGTDHSSSVRSPRRCGNLRNARFSFSPSASEEYLIERHCKRTFLAGSERTPASYQGSWCPVIRAGQFRCRLCSRERSEYSRQTASTTSRLLTLRRSGV